MKVSLQKRPPEPNLYRGNIFLPDLHKVDSLELVMRKQDLTPQEVDQLHHMHAHQESLSIEEARDELEDWDTIVAVESGKVRGYIKFDRGPNDIFFSRIKTEQSGLRPNAVGWELFKGLLKIASDEGYKWIERTDLSIIGEKFLSRIDNTFQSKIVDDEMINVPELIEAIRLRGIKLTDMGIRKK